MKKFWIKCFLGLIIIFLLFLPFLPFLHKDSAYYAYKEVSYTTVLRHLIGKEREQQKVSIIVLDYLYNNLFIPKGAKPIDKDVYNDLIRGIAWCDQRAWAMGTFLGKLGIDNRMLFTKNPQGESNHSVSEVFLDGKWRFFDPFFGIFIKDDKGQLLSFMDICNNPSLFYLSPEMIMLRSAEPDKYAVVKKFFCENIFYNNPVKPSIWGNPRRNRNLQHKLITKTLDSYIYLFGDTFSNIFQDFSLKYFAPKKESERIYFYARNYDLYNRTQLAINSYKKLISNFPQEPLSEDASFFLGVLYHKIRAFESSIQTFQALLSNYPATKWKRVAYYYLGYNNELLGNDESAKDYYWQAIKIHAELDPQDLRPTELRIARRLYNLINKPLK